MIQPFGTIRDIRKEFPGARGNPSTVALEPVSYDLKRGTLVALLGPSGCGKTTFLRIVGGMTAATGGTVKIDDKTVSAPSEDFAFVFQVPNLLPWRTVLGNILFPMEVQRRNDAVGKRRAHELLELVGLQHFAKSRPHELSGGMKQRVALCRALIQKPRLLLMDEPFGALDELTRMEMNDLLLEIRRVTGVTVLFVTHSIAEAVYVADEILVFSARPGRVIDQIGVDFAYPRKPVIRYSPRFAEYEKRAGAGLGVLHAHE